MQDEEYAGFGGPHCMIVGGYSQVTSALASQLDVRCNCAAMAVSSDDSSVRVTCTSGEAFEGQAAIITAPLGCLKAGDIRFQPPLPPWKQDAIDKLGFGALNKVWLVQQAGVRVKAKVGVALLWKAVCYRRMRFYPVPHFIDEDYGVHVGICMLACFVLECRGSA